MAKTVDIKVRLRQSVEKTGERLRRARQVREAAQEESRRIKTERGNKG